MKRLHTNQPRTAVSSAYTVVAVLIVTAIAVGMILSQSNFTAQPRSDGPVLVPATNSNGLVSQDVAGAQAKRYEVTINRPAGPPRVGTGMVGANGEEMTVACSTCHAVRPPNFENRQASDLNEFHAGLTFVHGNLTCLSCHNSGDYDSLALANGTRIEYPDVMQLCAQCHGKQMTDYEHGAHGGMNGYWDLSRGPRTRNNCIDCHDPHSPAFPAMQPTFKPRDRFLSATDDHHE